MQTIDIQEVSTDLSELIERAAKGEPFIIARAGKPMVQVTAVEAPLATPRPKRRFGFLKGQMGAPHVFDPEFVDHEIIAMFEGEQE